MTVLGLMILVGQTRRIKELLMGEFLNNSGGKQVLRSTNLGAWEESALS